MAFHNPLTNDLSMKKNTQKILLFLSATLFMVFSSSIVFSQENSETVKTRNCNLSLKEVQNKSFPLTNGSKQIVTYAVSNFSDTEECWIKLKQVAAAITKSSEIAGVYYFTLPPDEIDEIDIMYKDFSQYGMNLIASFWKDPDSGPELNRFPNNANDGQ